MLAYGFAAGLSDIEATTSALSAYVLTLQFFVGLLIRERDIPKWLRWYASVNALKHAWDALMINQFEGTQLYIFDDLEVSFCRTVYNLSDQPQRTMYYVFVQTLQFYGLRTGQKWLSLAKQCCFVPVFFSFSWLAFRFCKHNR